MKTNKIPTDKDWLNAGFEYNVVATGRTKYFKYYPDGTKFDYFMGAFAASFLSDQGIQTASIQNPTMQEIIDFVRNETGLIISFEPKKKKKTKKQLKKKIKTLKQDYDTLLTIYKKSTEAKDKDKWHVHNEEKLKTWLNSCIFDMEEPPYIHTFVGFSEEDLQAMFGELEEDVKSEEAATKKAIYEVKEFEALEEENKALKNKLKEVNFISKA